jgi:hypothetical protein
MEHGGYAAQLVLGDNVRIAAAVVYPVRAHRLHLPHLDYGSKGLLLY